MMAITRPTTTVPLPTRKLTARRMTETTINRSASAGAQPRGAPSGRICAGWGNRLMVTGGRSPDEEEGEDADATQMHKGDADVPNQGENVATSVR